MSRTFRDIRRIKARQWWKKLWEWQENESCNPRIWHWRHAPRDLLIFYERIREFPVMGKSWRKAAARRDRHNIKDSLRHNTLLWYYRRRKRDDDGS